MPGRFGLEYVGRDGELHQPAMLHRAILGSLERFLAIYIEHTGGDFPFWLAPIQVAILPISEKQQGYAEKLAAALARVKIRAQLDDRSETLGFKIREAEVQKVPLMLVVGESEVENGTVTPRLRHAKKQSREATGVEALIAELTEAVEVRRQVPLK
jgi:threonyl-tRNA synthetase